MLKLGRPLRGGYEACHTCPNRHCVAQAHIYEGTRSENIRDAVRDGTHAQARKTHCPQGHEYTPENTRVISGGRFCKTCDRQSSLEYSRRKRKMT